MIVEQNISLKNKFAVITGASSGIGKAIALALSTEGAKLCLLGRNSETLEDVGQIARETSSHVSNYQIDLTIDEQINKLIYHLQQKYNSIDILIHSAGVISLGYMESSSVKDLDWQYRTNLRAPYILTQKLLPMIKACRGQIVFINSSSGLNATSANDGQYAATKHALRAIANSLRQEINADGIRVLSVYPGRTASTMQAAIFKMEGREYNPQLLMQPEDVASIVINALKLPLSVEVTDIQARPLKKSY